MYIVIETKILEQMTGKLFYEKLFTIISIIKHTSTNCDYYPYSKKQLH